MPKVEINCVTSYGLKVDIFHLHVGHFGKIYKGMYKKPGASGAGVEVAVKTIKNFDSKVETERFLKEMSMMSNLFHPNIVRFYGLVQRPGSYISSYISPV